MGEIKDRLKRIGRFYVVRDGKTGIVHVRDKYSLTSGSFRSHKVALMWIEDMITYWGDPRV